jgi:hypothetical protein
MRLWHSRIEVQADVPRFARHLSGGAPLVSYGPQRDEPGSDWGASQDGVDDFLHLTGNPGCVREYDSRFGGVQFLLQLATHHEALCPLRVAGHKLGTSLEFGPTRYLPVSLH